MLPPPDTRQIHPPAIQEAPYHNIICRKPAKGSQMLIDDLDAELVTRSRPLFSENGETVAALFYERLFELAPDLRDMFPADLVEQNRKLSATLTVAVSSIRDWETLAPILAALARRHVVYGVHAWHYAVVTRALLDTLVKGGVDGATILAWNRLLSTICSHMIACAYGREPDTLANRN